jgi:hypothetical protein
MPGSLDLLVNARGYLRRKENPDPGIASKSQNLRIKLEPDRGGPSTFRATVPAPAASPPAFPVRGQANP